MHKVKLILFIFSGFLFVCLIFIAVLIFSIDEHFLASTLTRITDYKIKIDGPLSFDISMDPSLSISDILIEPDEGEDGLLSAQIGHVRIKIALKPLLLGAYLIRELDIHDAEVSYVIEPGLRPERDDGAALREKLADIEIPILESVTLQNINVSYLNKDSDYRLQALLHSFNIDDVRDRGPLYVKGSGAVNKTEFFIDGQLGSVSDALSHIQPYPVDLNLSMSDLVFKMSGTINDPVDGKGLNMLVSVDKAELSDLFKSMNVDVPGLGNLDLDARLTGDIEASRVSDLKLKVSGESTTELSAEGSIKNLQTGEGTDIAMSASTSNKDMIRLLPEDFHVFDELTFKGTLRNIKGDYLVEDLSLTLEKGQEATIKARGNILIGRTLYDPVGSKSDLRLNMAAKSTSLIKSLLFDWLPDTGPVNGEAYLTGSLIDLELKDINITAGELKNVWINAQGRVGSIPLGQGQGVTGIDLSLLIKAGKAPQLFANLGFELPEINDVSAQTRLHGSGEHLIVDGITAHMTDPDGVAADVSGKYIMEKQETGEYLVTYDLDMSMNAPSLSTFRRLLAAKALPDLKPAKASFHLSGTTEAMSLEDMLIQAGQPGPLHFTWKGRVGKVTIGSDRPISEVEIAASFYAEKTSMLSPYAGISIPDFGPIEGTTRIVARKDGYGYDDIEFVIGGKGNVLMRAAGSIEHVMRGTDLAFDGIDVSFELRDLNSRIIADHVEKDILDIGKINGSVSLSGNADDLSVSDIVFTSVSSEGVKASIHGGVQHIRSEKDMPFQGINIELEAGAPDLTAIKNITGVDFPDLGPLNIKAIVNDHDEDLHVETFLLHAGPKKEPLLLIEGSMNDILNTALIDLSLSFEAATRPWTEKLYGHKVPEDHRVRGGASFTGSKDHLSIEGTAASGKTDVNTTIVISHMNERRSVVANVTAPKIYLDDLGIYPEVQEGKASAKKDDVTPGKKIFSDDPYSFPGLENLDVLFRLDADKVLGRGFTLSNMNINVSLDNDRLLIGPSKMTYADGFVSLDVAVDMKDADPEVKFEFTAEDVDIPQLLAHVHSPLILGGHLNLFVDLQSSGKSPREMASALTGELGIAVEHGQVKQIADLMGADAIDLVTSARRLGTYQKLNCLAMRFLFEEGIGNSEIIYIDTPDVRSQGRGTVNLEEETLDLVIQPTPKRRRLGGSSAVTIKGPLNQPSVKKLPLIEAARLFGEIFMPYAFLPARVFGHVGHMMTNDTDEESPCLRPESQSN
jgi:hypothetical protein